MNLTASVHGVITIYNVLVLCCRSSSEWDLPARPGPSGECQTVISLSETTLAKTGIRGNSMIRDPAISGTCMTPASLATGRTCMNTLNPLRHFDTALQHIVILYM